MHSFFKYRKYKQKYLQAEAFTIPLGANPFGANPFSAIRRIAEFLNNDDNKKFTIASQEKLCFESFTPTYI